MPTIQIVAPPLPARRHGLFSVAQPITVERFGIVQFKENCPGEINIAQDPCDTPVAKTTRSDSWSELEPFYAYSLTECGPFGEPVDGRPFHDQNLEYAFEVAANTLLTGTTNTEAATDIADLIAKAAAHIGSVLFLPLATAVAANDYLDIIDGDLYVKATGQPVTVSPAYTVAGVITGPMYHRDANPDVVEAFNTTTNQRYQLVEGMYAFGASCEDGVVRITVA